MATANEVLKQVRATLDDPSHWTQNCSARDSFGRVLDCAWDKDATCWCLSGMIWKVSHDLIPGEMEPEASDRRVLAYKAMSALRCEMGTDSSIADFNDNVEHRHVLEVLDRAIH